MRVPSGSSATFVATRATWAAAALVGAVALVVTAPACARSVNWSVEPSSGSLLLIVLFAGIGLLVSGAVVEVARRAARGSWWCVPFLFALSAGAGAAVWILPLGGLNGHLAGDLDPPCEPATPPLFGGFIILGAWTALLTPVLLLLIWFIGRLSSRKESIH